MIRALYSSATGMKAQEMLLDVTANNLANVNTNGFKRSHVDFADLLYSNVRQSGGEVSVGQSSPVGLEIGSGARATGTTKLFTAGTLEETRNATDVAIEHASRGSADALFGGGRVDDAATDSSASTTR